MGDVFAERNARFLASPEPLDVGPVAHHHKYAEDDPQNDQRKRLVGQDHNDGQEYGGDDRGERNKSSRKKDPQPHQKGKKQNGANDGDLERQPDQRAEARGDTFASFEIKKDRPVVAADHNQRQHYAVPHLGQPENVADERDRQDTFKDVQGQHDGPGPFPEDPEHVGRAHVTRTVFADIDALIDPAENIGGGDRAQKITGPQGQNKFHALAPLSAFAE